MSSVTLHTTAHDDDGSVHVEGPFPLTGHRAVREDTPALFVNPERQFQTLVGIGAAITDASAEVYAGLPEDSQRAILDACWNPTTGNGYALARTSIHSCDFSSGSYTYVDDGDEALATFDVAHDRRHRIPLVRAAREVAGGDLKLLASPWSAPAWMKDNDSMLGGGRLRPEYHGLWARYVAHFLTAWAEEGLPFWGLTVQNEPAAEQRWESMLWTAAEERDFVRHHLAPTLAEAGLADVRIIGWDHNRDLLPHRARVILDDPEAAKLFWGMGFHWYETWSGSDQLFRNVAAVCAAHPEANLLMTEACVEGFDRDRLDDWAHAEHYARALIGDLGAGACAWIDWNFLLDTEGGPNHVGNFCFAPVHADPESGEVIFTRSHRVLGHFSRFLKPGGQRIDATTSRSALATVAFRAPEGHLVVVVLNEDGEETAYDLHVSDDAVQLRIPGHALQTLVCEA